MASILGGRDAVGYSVTKSERIYDGPIFTLRRDAVEFPDGSSATRDVVSHDGAVAIVPIDADGRVVLIEQYRHSVAQMLWEVPAGLLDVAGEHALDAAKRELAEEVGLRATSWHTLIDLVSAPGFCDERVRVFLARELSEAPRPDGFVLEHEEAQVAVHRVPLADAVAAVHAGEVVNSLAVGALLAAERALREENVLRAADIPWPA
ncbi:NUDIX domain-containing protein [Cumulibacter soli]|uniref:NUDIX domain-containing protein n=1 Tax=Cumulibacter soli TaxID=2546344 RepID=UPI0010682814|nr:NUDIX hydrolase [Cumulibacter soli]